MNHATTRSRILIKLIQYYIRVHLEPKAVFCITELELTVLLNKFYLMLGNN